jgi:peptidoglycan/xylan/chitin deacetylase (PgdA/CDA1 family)
LSTGDGTNIATGVWRDWPLILAYHSVSRERRDALAVRTDEFEWQMRWLRERGYRTVTLADYTAEPPPRGERIAILTFDDGYRDNHSEAFPILKKFGFVGTFFLVADYVDTDRTFAWDEAQLDPAARSDFETLTWQQIHEMAADGHEFGSHTCSHRELVGLRPDECAEEVTRSRAELGAALGREVVTFCYPRGSLDASVIAAVERAGYRAAVVTPPRSGIPLSRFTLRRVGVYQGNTRRAFRFKLTRLARMNQERLKWLQGKRGGTG